MLYLDMAIDGGVAALPGSPVKSTSECIELSEFMQCFPYINFTKLVQLLDCVNDSMKVWKGQHTLEGIACPFFFFFLELCMPSKIFRFYQNIP